MDSSKVDDGAQARRRRWYPDACAAAHALDLVGERWALLVMRELMFGPKRFSDLRDSLPGISANVLTQRLATLQAANVLVRRKLPPPAGAWVYELTEWGYESEPIFAALGRWGARSTGHDLAMPFSTASCLLSLRTMFNTDRAEGLNARIGLRLGQEVYLARCADGAIDIAPGPARDAEVTLTTTPRALAAAVYLGRPLAELEASGDVQVAGDRALGERFFDLFCLPDKAEHSV